MREKGAVHFRLGSDVMESGVQQQEHAPIACTSCGRKFRHKPELAGRTVKCPCGSTILIPRPPTPGGATGEDGGEYDFAEPVVKRAPAVASPSVAGAAAPAVGLGAPPGAADAPLPQAASTTAATGPVIRADLPPQRRGLKPEERKCEHEPAPTSTIGDFVIPAILILLGIGLRFVEVLAPFATKDPMAFGPGSGAVATKVFLSVVLMLAGMWVAVQVMEVCFVGDMERTCLKLISIAVFPGAIYGILSHAGGEPYGAMLGTFVSLAVYGLLFALLMRLDVKDTGICVIVTWIMVTGANYAAYRFEGLVRDAWV